MVGLRKKFQHWVPTGKKKKIIKPVQSYAYLMWNPIIKLKVPWDSDLFCQMSASSARPYLFLGESICSESDACGMYQPTFTCVSQTVLQ